MEGTNVNLEAEKEGMLGSTQQATTIAGLPPEKLVLNRRPLEDKVSTPPSPSFADTTPQNEVQAVRRVFFLNLFISGTGASKPVIHIEIQYGPVNCYPSCGQS